MKFINKLILQLIITVTIFISIIAIEIKYSTNTLYHIQRTLKKLTREFHCLCEDLGIKYWMTAGTLLGTYREGDFVRHDDDIDLCMKLEDVITLKKNNMGIKPFIGEWTGIWRYSKRGMKGCLDIFPTVLEDNKYHYIKNARKLWPNEYFDSQDIDQLVLYNFGKYDIENKIEDLYLYGPNNLSKYVKRFYGDGWQKPIVYYPHTVIGFRNSYLYSTLIAFTLLIIIIVEIVLLVNVYCAKTFT